MSTESLNVRSVFDRALEIPSEAERTAFLDEVCVESPEIRLQVEALLKAHADAGSFLQQPAIDRNQTAAFCPAIESPGRQIGPYKLLEQIGEGGMGVVFMAEQTRPVQRRVALKIIKLGMDTRQVVARFEAERQALAMMDHPNIARVLDAGETETGRPYFVMELVRGVPITEFCDQGSLSIPDRLALFVTVCQAVQHAHQKGIIHRDIKPTNVLVTLHDGVPVIKVIDFGVAKATGQKLTEKTLFTGLTQMIGTPLYMSPEQAEMSGLDVDTRSDIFSTGVLLYELLTGTTPFDNQRLKSVSFDELRRIIREEEPPRPSTQITTLAAETASTVGTKRKSDARQLSRLFRGELDWIVMKCLEKDRTRRYETASALAGDVERYLHDEPVQACPPSARYRFGKFARRNKAALVTTSIVMVALVVGTVVSRLQTIRAFNAEQAETLQRKRAEEISKLLVSFLRSPDPARDGRGITVAEVLDRSAKELQDKFANDPVTKAKMLQAIGESYLGLGLIKESVPLLVQARESFIMASGQEHADTLDAENKLANAYHASGRYDLAARLEEEILKVRRTKLGPDHADTLATMTDLADDYSEDKPQLAIPLLEEAFRLQKTNLGPQNPLTLRSMSLLGGVYARHDRAAEGLPILEEALKLQTSKLGSDHPDTLRSKFNLACVCDQPTVAVPMLEEIVKLQKAKLGPEHIDTLRSMSALAALYGIAGRMREAVPMLEEVVKLQKEKLGPGHIKTYVSTRNLAVAYLQTGRTDEAISLFEGMRDVLKMLPDEIREGEDTTYYLTAAYMKKVEDLTHQGKADETEWRSFGRPRQPFGLGVVYISALRGKWANAATDYAKVIDQLPFGDESFEYAGLLILQDDKQGYQRYCKKFVAIPTGIPPGHYNWYECSALNLARMFALGPADTVDGSKMVEWAALGLSNAPAVTEQVLHHPLVAPEKIPWALHVMGLACLRAGQYDAAIENIQKSNAAGWAGKASESLNCLVLSMVHHRLAHVDEARRYLKLARERFELFKPTSDEQIDVPDWIEANVLLREAESLLKSDSSNPKSQTPMPHS